MEIGIGERSKSIVFRMQPTGFRGRGVFQRTVSAISARVPGDISGPTQGVYDGTCNMRDIQYLILLFTTKPSSPNWNPNADINNDATVNMRDISIAILNFNKHE